MKSVGSENPYVQFGCGFCAPVGWLNFDASPTLRFERLPLMGRVYTKNTHRFPNGVEYGDITKGLPIAPNSCRGIYCSHVLEHLALAEFDIALSNTFSYLKPNGVFRLVVPE
jgi:Methyltransferase domain